MAMMNFTKRPGELPINEQENCILFGCNRPNTIKLPPELGGETLKVLHIFEARCPVNKARFCTHYQLENGFFVAESDKFYWYRKD